jgi:membrane protein required for colicin V production
MNSKYTLVEKKTIEKSLFYNPIQKVAAYVYPTMEEWFEDLKK